MKKIGKWLGILFLVLTVVVGISGRRISELMGYARATADKTVEQLEDSVPAAVRDQKLQNDIETARGEIIDRRVKLNLAASEVRRLQDEVGQLTAAVERRELILAEAYPALETASADRLTEVSFAGTKWQPVELGGEVDRLLMEQDRDERTDEGACQEPQCRRLEGHPGSIEQFGSLGPDRLEYPLRFW